MSLRRKVLGHDALKSLFTQALVLPPDRRAEFVAEACGGDADAGRDVMSLLNAFGDATDYFERLSRSFRPDREGVDRQDMPADPHRLIGSRIADYRILELIGGGGMGVVYLARHSKLDRLAALKFLPLHLSDDPQAKAQFLHEAKAASTLDHPGVCTIYDIGETPAGQLYIAMAYYDGETLKEKLIRGALPLPDAIDVAMQIARGLAKAHACGIVHRDVKAANVMITSDGEAKLLDFGVAKVADAQNTAAVAGSVGYMSPEHAAGEPVDARTDLWSLGILMFEMVWGRRPLALDHERARLRSIIDADPISDPDHEIPPELCIVIHRCLEKDPGLRYQSADDLWRHLHRIANRFETGAGTRVLVSFDPGAEGDRHVAMAISSALEPHCDVFLNDLSESNWTKQLEQALARTDVMVLLLSEQSLHSEMVVAQIETIYERAQPAVVLPVRLATVEPLGYPLSNYLIGRPAAYWNGEEDTQRLVAELTSAIVEGRRDFSTQARTALRATPSFEPRIAAQRLEMPEGTMSPLSSLYVTRPEDTVALRAIAQQGVTITIKGPRQMGKSSLLMRTMAAAQKLGKEVVFLDLQLIDSAGLRDAELFFRQFCVWISDELDLEDRLDAYWKSPMSNAQRCTRYMEGYVLKTAGRPVVLAIDEVERVFDTDFRSDFFSMLRSWHNDRAIKPRWKGLDLALVTSTEPYQLIENLNQSPFNVGEVISLKEFTVEQVADLNRRHGTPLSDREIQQLQDLVGGHPYLTRRALYLVARRRNTMQEILATATDENGPFGDHLRYHLFRLDRQTNLRAGMRQILRERRCEDEGVFWRLRAAGLVGRSGGDVLPRTRLYAEYFRTRLHA